MSTIQTTNLKHESSGSNNIVLDSSGNIAVQAGTVSAPAIQATGDSNTGIYFPAADTIAFTEGGSEAVRIDSSGNLRFNSGYGSVATAYGCRAWVNFDGTGTVAIRASGNVGSITDQGTGDYAVNITTAMPDANYATVATCANTSGNPEFLQVFNSQTTNGVRIIIKYPGITNYDSALVAVAIFR